MSPATTVYLSAFCGRVRLLQRGAIWSSAIFRRKLIPPGMCCLFTPTLQAFIQTRYECRTMREEAIESSAYVRNRGPSLHKALCKCGFLVAHYWNESSREKIECARARPHAREKGMKDTKSWIRGNFPANDFVTEFHSACWRGQPLKARPTKLGRSVSKRGMLREMSFYTWEAFYEREIFLCPNLLDEKCLWYPFVNLSRVYLRFHLFINAETSFDNVIQNRSHVKYARIYY